MAEAIIGLVLEIAKIMGDVGLDVSNNLTMPLKDFSESLRDWAFAVAENVILPAAFCVLALFALLELHKIATKSQDSGAGQAFAADLVFKALFKVAVCKEALALTPKIMEWIYNLSVEAVKAIQGEGVAAALFSVSLNVGSLKMEIDGMGFFSQLSTFILCVLVKFVVWGAVVYANAVIFGRFAEIFLLVCLSPIPMATFPSEEMSQIGKGFLKSFAALCWQGVVIYLAFSFFPAMAGPILKNMADIGTIADLNKSMGKVLACSVLLVTMVASSKKFANTVFGAS